MRRRGRIDSPGRHAALALGGGRVALGVGALFATGPTLKALGFDGGGEAARALAKLVGGRDLALGLVTLASRDDAARLRTVALTAAALDAADAVSLGLMARDEDTRLAGLVGLASGGTAAIAGLWASQRLGNR